MGHRSFNGGGTLLVVSEFDHNEMGSPPPNWRSRYMREFSEVKSDKTYLLGLLLVGLSWKRWLRGTLHIGSREAIPH